MNRLLIPHSIWSALDAHLSRSSPNEDGAFMLLRSGRGSQDTRIMVTELVLPEEGNWESQGQHRLRPSGQWLSSVIGMAVEADCGLAFVHSHPDSHHPPDLSPIDRQTSREWGRSLTPTLRRVFLSLVWTEAGLRGWKFEPHSPDKAEEVDRVQILGAGRSEVLGESDTGPIDTQLDERQIQALGEIGNRQLRDLRVGVVGVGGTGSPIAEQLARIGVREVVLVDPDVLDTPSNLRRIVGSRAADLPRRSPKVDIVSRYIASLGLGVSVRPYAIDVREERAARQLLDCDLVISTTDTHSSRALVNQLAHQYFLPVIDVGVKVGTSRSGTITGMPADVRVLLPDTGCLWCWGLLDPARIRAENLPDEERATQIREGYIQDIDEPQPSLAVLNQFASSITLLTMLRLLASVGIVSAHTIADGWEHYFADREDAIDPTCVCHNWRGTGDGQPMSFLPSVPRSGARPG